MKKYKVKLVEIVKVKFDNKGYPVETIVKAKSKKEAEKLAIKWASKNDGEFNTWIIAGDEHYIVESIEVIKKCECSVYGSALCELHKNGEESK